MLLNTTEHLQNAECSTEHCLVDVRLQGRRGGVSARLGHVGEPALQRGPLIGLVEDLKGSGELGLGTVLERRDVGADDRPVYD